MPNVKIFVEEALFASKSGALRDALLPLREMLCKGFKVDVAACQFAVTPVMAMPDLPLVNVEMHILPRADRTRDAVLAVCNSVQGLIEAATGTHAAIRVSFLDAATYIALK